MIPSTSSDAFAALGASMTTLSTLDAGEALWGDADPLDVSEAEQAIGPNCFSTLQDVKDISANTVAEFADNREDTFSQCVNFMQDQAKARTDTFSRNVTFIAGALSNVLTGKAA